MPIDDDLRDMIEHDTTKAQILLKDLAEAMPRSIPTLMLLAMSHIRRLEFEQALVFYRRVLAVDPRHQDALLAITTCFIGMNDYEKALAACRQAFNATSSTLALRVSGLLSHRLGRLDAAIAFYEKVIAGAGQASAERPLAQQGLAAVLRDAGRPLDADQHTRSLIERFRRQPAIFSSLLISRNSAEDFPEWTRYADKANLGLVLTRRRAVDAAGRVPETFVLPQERSALAAFAAGPHAPPLYIVKPIRSSGGQGISVTADIAIAIDRQDVVVQRYLDRPYLVNGRKGHARIYGLVTSAAPLRAYVYSEGLVRFAPEPYAPRPDEVGGPAMHITNTALHLDHPEMFISQDAAQEDVGLLWSLTALLRRIDADGGNGAAVFAEIKVLMEWFVRALAAEGLFERQAARAPARAFAPKLFGLDVLIDADGHPWLIEMQRIPAATGAPLLNRVNGLMYANIFHMTHGPLLNETMPADQAAAIKSNPAALARRELEIEQANRGRFAALDV